MQCCSCSTIWSDLSPVGLNDDIQTIPLAFLCRAPTGINSSFVRFSGSKVILSSLLLAGDILSADGVTVEERDAV